MLIEREEELAALRRAHQDVPNGGGRVLLIYGDAGTGKTSLIGEFLKTLPADTRVAQSMCDPLSTPRPMGLLREISSAIAGVHGSCETELAEDLVQRLTNANSLQIIVMEDVHWADQASIDWLKYVCRRITQIPALLIVTFRDVEVAPDHPLRSALGVIPNDRTERLHLQPLSREGVEALDLPKGVSAGQLFDITAGNPFFVTEILANSGDLQSVPESIRDAVNSRVNRLPDSLRAMLEAASCFPGRIDEVVLEQATGKSASDDLAAAERLGFLTYRNNAYRFRHELARLATQGRLIEPEKKRVHGLALEALLGEADPVPHLAEIVHHAQGSGDSEAIIRFAPMAAKEAARIGAHRDAAQYLSAALEHVASADRETTAEIHEKWAYEAGLALSIDQQVIAARERAVELWRSLDRMDKVGENLRWLSRLHWYRGEPEKAQAYLEEAIGILQQIPSEAAATAYGLRAQFHMLQDEMEAAQEWGRKALDLAEKVGAVEVKAHALNTVGTAKLFRGDLEGESLLRESLALSLQHGFHEQAARVYTNLSECLIELGETAKAELFSRRGYQF